MGGDNLPITPGSTQGNAHGRHAVQGDCYNIATDRQTEIGVFFAKVCCTVNSVLSLVAAACIHV